MSKWTDKGEWSDWVCAHDGCGCEHSDPDTVSVTTCANGHTNYLGVLEGRCHNVRKAYKSAKERAKDIREHRTLVKLFSDAIHAGRTTIVKSGRKPNL